MFLEATFCSLVPSEVCLQSVNNAWHEPNRESTMIKYGGLTRYNKQLVHSSDVRPCGPPNNILFTRYINQAAQIITKYSFKQPACTQEPNKKPNNL